jgi:hypothetical protein
MLKTKARQRSSFMTLQKAIELGEYNPEFLSSFPEFISLSRHSQFQMVKEALENRRHQLLHQWADVNNMLDFSKKPHLQQALKNIEKQLKNLEDDREKIYTEYSKA